MPEGGGRFEIELAGEHVRGLAPGVDRQHLQRLVRGDVEIEVEIDLHGYTTPEARRLVTHTLGEMLRAGERCARIVHGRGRHSEAGPVLKAGVLDWLTSAPLASQVLAFATAPPAEGGAGATLVLLRRARGVIGTQNLVSSAAMASSFGTLFRIATFGESHGGAVGVVVDGCPPRLALDAADVQRDLDRRRPGQSRFTTPRQETDRVEIVSGVFEGRTLGSPIAMIVRNEDARPAAYEDMKDLFRPSHADYTTEAKYGIRNWQGGGRASARETIGRVAAAAIARKLLREVAGIEVLAFVARVQAIEAKVDLETLALADIEASPVRCPDAEAAQRMEKAIDAARRRQDSLGGVVRCIARGVPAGLGEPVFDKLEADLAKGLLSLPAAKGFEIGSGFAGTLLTGSEHNDAFAPGPEGRPRTLTNRSGGVQGGISNGERIELAVAFKPTATIGIAQRTVDRDNEPATLAATGRHDPCVLPRAVPMVEAMVLLVLADHWLRQRAVDVLGR